MLNTSQCAVHISLLVVKPLLTKICFRIRVSCKARQVVVVVLPNPILFRNRVNRHLVVVVFVVVVVVVVVSVVVNLGMINFKMSKMRVSIGSTQLPSRFQAITKMMTMNQSERQLKEMMTILNASSSCCMPRVFSILQT